MTAVDEAAHAYAEALRATRLFKQRMDELQVEYDQARGVYSALLTSELDAQQAVDQALLDAGVSA